MSKLYAFVSTEMLMKSDAQPSVVRRLLRNRGNMAIEKITAAYYQELGGNLEPRQAKNRVVTALQVLGWRGHTHKASGVARLIEYEQISEAERLQIDRICTLKVMTWRETHGLQ